MKKLFIITILLISAIWCYAQVSKGYTRTHITIPSPPPYTIKTDSIIMIRISLSDGNASWFHKDFKFPPAVQFLTAQDTTCVKDTAEAYLQIQACDSCKVRLRIGFVVADKCSPTGNPEIIEYINVYFLDIKRIPLPERATVIKYTRKN